MSAPTSLDATLLDQILADPADDALRLVYADRLLAEGDPRGEYITIEARLAAAPRGSAEHGMLARRRGELRAAHGVAWWPELPEQRLGTRCGFVERIAVFASELGVVAELARREPIAVLELIDYPRRAPPLPASWQAQIRRLVIHADPTWDDLASLWEGPLGDAVEELAVSSRSFIYGRLPPLGHHLPRCRKLHLAGSRLEDIVPDSPLRELMQWDHVARLEVLDLSHCRGLAVAAVHVLASLDLAALRVLRLSGSSIGDDGALVLASHLRALPALQRLELLDAQIGERGAAALRAVATRAEIVLEAQPPSRIAIDAVGSEVELFQVNESAWAIAIDGARRPIRIRQRDARRAPIETIAERAQLGPVVRALWMGVPPRLQADAISVAVGRHDDALLAIAPDRSELVYEPP